MKSGFLTIQLLRGVSASSSSAVLATFIFDSRNSSVPRVRVRVRVIGVGPA